MLPLLFIVVVTGMSILVSYHFSSQASWFTYYVGGVAGLLVAGIALEYWNKRKKD